MRLRLLALASLLLPIAACSDDPVASYPADRQPATLDRGDGNVQVSFAPTVRVGERLTVEVVAWGAAGCTEQAETAVSSSGNVAIVRPYARLLFGAGAACEGAPTSWSHRFEVSFSRSGIGVLRIHGLHGPHGTPMTVERTVSVLD